MRYGSVLADEDSVIAQRTAIGTAVYAAEHAPDGTAHFWSHCAAFVPAKWTAIIGPHDAAVWSTESSALLGANFAADNTAQQTAQCSALKSTVDAALCATFRSTLGPAEFAA